MLLLLMRYSLKVRLLCIRNQQLKSINFKQMRCILLYSLHISIHKQSASNYIPATQVIYRRLGKFQCKKFVNLILLPN